MRHYIVTDDLPDLGGRLIDNGRLELLDGLGSGAYGKVYRARDTTSPHDKQVFYAVKCLLRPEIGSYQEGLQKREFKIHKLVCGHPNIVTLHRIVYERDFVYVVLDLCTGGDLFAAITEAHIFHNNVQLVKSFFIQLIDAVQYCHELSVFHRDLKPENVLCTEDGSGIRLADFGLSSRNHLSKDFGCGSSYYMSPECIGQEFFVGKYSTRHSDIWSLGIILTNMISGRNPWRYATAKDECFSAYLHNEDFLRQALPISRGASSILKRIFQVNPLCRISLVELRKEILALDTFYMVEEDVTGGTPVHVTRRCSKSGKVSSIIFNSSNSSVRSDSSVSSDEVYAFDSPRDDNTPLHSPELLEASISGPEETPVSCGSSSDPDSDGPITPDSCPVDPAVEVPELPKNENLGQPVISTPQTQLSSQIAGISIDVTKPKRRQLLRKVLGRLIDLPPIP